MHNISDYPIKILPNSFALYIFWQTIGIHDYNIIVFIIEK